MSSILEADTMARPASGYVAWNLALFEVLLPVFPDARRGGPALLCCDDEVIRTTGARLGIAREEAVQKFATAVELQWRLRDEDTLKRVRRACILFRGRDKSVVAPPFFLGALALLVLAASRMTAGVEHATHNYYERLWELVGEPRTGRHDLSYIPHAFALLAEWLRDDLDGRHGHLLLPEPGRLAYVGVAINQCVFRRRDRELLAHFFADRWPQQSMNIDPLRLLQLSSHRHVLTDRAQRALADPAQEDLVRTALYIARESWDGSLPQADGGRGWRARLQLGLRPHLRLLYSVPGAPSPIRIAPGRLLRPGIDREQLPLDRLATLRIRPITIGDRRSGAVVVPCCGETLVFESHEDAGLVWVERATEETVFVLSCSASVKSALTVYMSRGSGLGAVAPGWALFARVPSSKLPAELLRAELGGQIPVRLTGGLRLDRRVYLTSAGPRVETSKLEDRLTVSVDGIPIAQLGSDATLQLELAEPKIYAVDVGGLRQERLAAVSGGEDPPYGEVLTRLDTASSRRGTGHALAAEMDGQTVCGALLDPPSPVIQLPLMRRSRAPVTLIDRDGGGRTVDPGRPPDWLREAGLDPAASRWEVPIHDDTVWVIAGREAINVCRDRQSPQQLDATARAAVAEMLARPPHLVRALRPDAEQDSAEAFRSLVGLIGLEEKE
jgi:hypothetical protein